MECSNCKQNKRIMARGLCSACYSRLRRTGDLRRTKRINKGQICDHPGCKQPAISCGLCSLHYQRAENPAKTIWKLLRSRNPGQYPAHWDDFSAFLADVGERPSLRHQLRRVRPDEPFSADNVAWLAPVGQQRPKGWTKEQRATYMREWAFRRKYGITLEEYNRRLAEQNGVCAICQNDERHHSSLRNKRHLSVDHCHQTSRVRGLLCSDCNHSLGGFKDSPAILRRAIAYLERHRENEEAA